MAGARAPEAIARNMAGLPRRQPGAAPEPIFRQPPAPPPAPPPLPAKPPAGPDAYDERYAEFLKKSLTLPPADQGNVRMYRVGQTSTNFVPPQTVRMFGRDMPWDEFRANMEEGHRTGPHPPGAAGRWFTDAPEELDFYIKDNELDTPIYYLDVPKPEAVAANVQNTPYAKNSRNHAKEFVLPEGLVSQATRLMSILAPLLLAPSREDR
jgi:hypothetical protein